jgi:hypothetical protein
MSQAQSEDGGKSRTTRNQHNRRQRRGSARLFCRGLVQASRKKHCPAPKSFLNNLEVIPQTLLFSCACGELLLRLLPRRRPLPPPPHHHLPDDCRAYAKHTTTNGVVSGRVHQAGLSEEHSKFLPPLSGGSHKIYKWQCPWWCRSLLG